MTKARPYLEEWLANASEEDRISVSEFIMVLEGPNVGDSGSVFHTLDALAKMCDISYIRHVLDGIEQDQKRRKEGQ